MSPVLDDLTAFTDAHEGSGCWKISLRGLTMQCASLHAIVPTESAQASLPDPVL